MATVSSTKVATGVQARAGHSGVQSVSATFSVPASGNGTVAADIIEMVKVPKGATVLEVILSSDDLDSNATPTHKFDVGDAGSATRYISGTTIGQSGGVARMGSGVAAPGTAYPFTYAAEDKVIVTVNTAAATKQAGVISLVVFFTMQG